MCKIVYFVDTVHGTGMQKYALEFNLQVLYLQLFTGVNCLVSTIVLETQLRGSVYSTKYVTQHEKWILCAHKI